MSSNFNFFYTKFIGLISRLGRALIIAINLLLRSEFFQKIKKRGAKSQRQTGIGRTNEPYGVIIFTTLISSPCGDSSTLPNSPVSIGVNCVYQFLCVHNNTFRYQWSGG